MAKRKLDCSWMLHSAKVRPCSSCLPAKMGCCWCGGMPSPGSWRRWCQTTPPRRRVIVLPVSVLTKICVPPRRRRMRTRCPKPCQPGSRLGRRVGFRDPARGRQNRLPLSASFNFLCLTVRVVASPAVKKRMDPELLTGWAGLGLPDGSFHADSLSS
jgi:hypothetical protein